MFSHTELGSTTEHNILHMSPHQVGSFLDECKKREWMVTFCFYKDLNKDIGRVETSSYRLIRTTKRFSYVKVHGSTRQKSVEGGSSVPCTESQVTTCRSRLSKDSNGSVHIFKTEQETGHYDLKNSTKEDSTESRV